jgi:hypothetical protein
MSAISCPASLLLGGILIRSCVLTDPDQQAFIRFPGTIGAGLAAFLNGIGESSRRPPSSRAVWQA